MTTPLTPLEQIRRDYIKSKLNEEDLHTDPIQQFITWFNEALTAEVMEPNAMTLGTASLSGQPNLRTVLLKHVDDQGFVFFTNYESQKGMEILQNNQVCLLFFWPELERQVRIWGKARKTSKETSEEYFHSRPRESQIGALVSPQSQIIKDRKVLIEKNKELTEIYKGNKIPMPEYWGGFQVAPSRVEFWQGGASRLHDRIVYESKNEKEWILNRLAP